jgi:hypothetical protein
MTKLEMAGLALANEIESNIQVGVPLTTNLILALNEFRKAQQEQDVSFGADLDAMYKQYLESEIARVEAKIGQCPVVELAKARRKKVTPVS